jgi:hypothetical protein
MQQRTASQASSKAIWTWEMLGVAFIVVAGSCLHFVYGWLGGAAAVALVAAVNESIWEHLKLAFWPGFLWALLENWRLPIPAKILWSIKGFALMVPPLLIVAIFGTYTAILGQNYLALDIGTFVIAVIAGQATSALLLHTLSRSHLVVLAGVGALALQIFAYAAFTYFPPDYHLFVDSRTGLSGLPPK